MNDVSQDGPDPLVGANVGGKYKIVRLLGEGGMGCVYLGEQQMGSAVRKVAVKTLHRHLSLDPQIRARFMRECGTVSELEHPNTIQVYDFGTTEEGLLYIVMEFVQGRSLADILEKDGPMQADRAINILTQVCGSLEEAHGRGIVHRDLKPDNIVLCEKAGKKDWVEVLDFGIAKRSSESDPNEQKLTQQGMVLGTPPYMSPEQFTGQPINAQSDIYSLGVMTYEMLTGKLPFNGNTAWEWASQHMTAQPQPFEVQPNGNLLPPAMRAAVMRSLEKAPEARFANVGEFLEALKGGGAAPVTQPSAGAAVNGRAKTEMAAPAVTPPGAMPGAYGPPPGMGMGGPPPGSGPVSPHMMPGMGGPPPGSGPASPHMAGPSYAAVPAGPQHSSARKSNTGLFIGLGVGALLLVGGGIAAAVAMSGGSKDPGPTGALTFNAPPPTTPASTAGSAPTDEPHGDNPLVALSTSKAVPVGPVGPKGTGKATAIPTPGVKPTSTAPPPACALAARYKSTNPALYERYATLCKAGGGTPP
jgi:serine/threonine-protein kinase